MADIELRCYNCLTIIPAQTPTYYDKNCYVYNNNMKINGILCNTCVETITSNGNNNRYICRKHKVSHNGDFEKMLSDPYMDITLNRDNKRWNTVQRLLYGMHPSVLSILCTDASSFWIEQNNNANAQIQHKLKMDEQQTKMMETHRKEMKKMIKRCEQKIFETNNKVKTEMERIQSKYKSQVKKNETLQNEYNIAIQKLKNMNMNSNNNNNNMGLADFHGENMNMNMNNFGNNSNRNSKRKRVNKAQPNVPPPNIGIRNNNMHNNTVHNNKKWKRQTRTNTNNYNAQSGLNFNENNHHSNRYGLSLNENNNHSNILNFCNTNNANNKQPNELLSFPNSGHYNNHNHNNSNHIHATPSNHATVWKKLQQRAQSNTVPKQIDYMQ